MEAGSSRRIRKELSLSILLESQKKETDVRRRGIRVDGIAEDLEQNTGRLSATANRVRGVSIRLDDIVNCVVDLAEVQDLRDGRHRHTAGAISRAQLQQLRDCLKFGFLKGGKAWSWFPQLKNLYSARSTMMLLGQKLREFRPKNVKNY